MKSILSDKDEKSIKLIKALTEYAINQNRPIEEIIHKFLPDIYNADESLTHKYHEVDKRIWKIENILESIDEKIRYRANKIFWMNFSISIGILAGIATIIALLISIF